MPGSDVDFLFNRVLPGLRRGVLLHVHDIFLPDGYPPEWEWRGYNEQLAIAPLLTGGAWRLLFASRYVATRLAVEVAASAVAALPSVPGALRFSSLWLERGLGREASLSLPSWSAKADHPRVDGPRSRQAQLSMLVPYR